MEWYYDSATVPNDDEMFDKISSPYSCSPWGKRVGIEEFLFSGDAFYSEADPPRNCQVSRNSFCQRSLLAHSDVQVNDFAGSDEADDIFLRSLFKADASEIQGTGTSANFSQTSSWNDLLSVNHNGERNNVEDDSSSAEAKEPEFGIGASSEHLNVSEYINEDEETYMDESVLLELQMSTLQLREDTRICFRDSLYRLAENSRQQTSCSQNAMEDCKTTASGASSRFEESNVEESNTNAIDRTVATLLFNTMKFCNIALASRLDLAEKTSQRKYDNLCSLKPDSSISSPYYVPGGDAEVPT
ncbi:hypothetical protein ACJIZ3_016000 [Penstemon smallii]|uniref:Uncharacterized protein n=1 Tax=Penstemon smallii TaxID=265156 RepID=A0ABD3RRG6_9LAMI